MKLNHANLPTSESARVAAFFTDHFAFQAIRPARPNFHVLRGEDGFILNIMQLKRATPYPSGFHVGFFLETPAEVHRKHAELDGAGLAPEEVKDLVRGGYASTTFYCRLPDDILVEVGAPR